MDTELKELCELGLTQKQAENVLAYMGNVQVISKLGRARLMKYLVKVPSIGEDTAKKITNQLKESALSKVLYKVNSKYGAPMGRANKGSLEEAKRERKRIYDSWVNLEQGYDKGGAYWGNPNNLRVSYTRDLTFINFYRKE